MVNFRHLVNLTFIYRLNLSYNRIGYHCAKLIAKGLAANQVLEELKVC